MIAQDNSEDDMPNDKPDQGGKAATERTKTDAKANTKRVKAEERARFKEALTNAQEDLAVAKMEIEQEREARINVEKELSEAEEALTTAEAKLEQERQGRIKAENAWAEAERVLKQESIVTKRTAVAKEIQPPAFGEEGTEQRVSFVVRLTVDERGQARRTEVEHAQSGKKSSFPILDGERLAAFMRACISTVATSEPTLRPVLAPVKVGIPTQVPREPTTPMSISDVRVFRIGTPDVTTMTLSPDEAFVVQAHFQLQGSEAAPLSAQESRYQLKVYANEVTGGRSKLLTTQSAHLVKNVLEYTPKAHAPRLSPGIYRLVTQVILYAPIKAASSHKELFVEVV